MRRALALGLVFFLPAGCRPRTAQVAADSCAAPTGTLAADARADGLVGPFHLTLVATSGPHAGARVTGSLSLIVADTQHYGSAEVDVERVGALPLGDLASADPATPGVRLFASPGDILLRLGSEANTSGVLRFDGGYTVLRVRDVSSDAFRGVWVSGVTDDQAAGYFCARRAVPG